MQPTDDEPTQAPKHQVAQAPWLAAGGDAMRSLTETRAHFEVLTDAMPQVRQVGADSSASGRNWIGMVRNDAYRVTSLTQKPLLPQWVTLLILASVLLLAWRVEGR